MHLFKIFKILSPLGKDFISETVTAFNKNNVKKYTIIAKKTANIIETILVKIFSKNEFKIKADKPHTIPAKRGFKTVTLKLGTILVSLIKKYIETTKINK